MSGFVINGFEQSTYIREIYVITILVTQADGKKTHSGRRRYHLSLANSPTANNCVARDLGSFRLGILVGPSSNLIRECYRSIIS